MMPEHPFNGNSDRVGSAISDCFQKWLGVNVDCWYVVPHTFCMPCFEWFCAQEAENCKKVSISEWDLCETLSSYPRKLPKILEVRMHWFCGTFERTTEFVWSIEVRVIGQQLYSDLLLPKLISSQVSGHVQQVDKLFSLNYINQLFYESWTS